ncbi:pectinesterase inhibitor 10 [Fagus crenata]
MSSLSSSSSSASSSSSLSPIGSTPRFLVPVVDRSAAKIKPHCAYHAHGKPSHSFLIHNENHWQ